MKPPEKCPKCGASMQEGFVVDKTHGGQLVSRWIEGRPEPSFWLGTRIGSKRQCEIRSYRCIGCGFLESYALEA